MAKLKILTYPNPQLKQKSVPVKALSREDRKTILEMIDVMYGDDGVGLAAPQIGISKRIIVVSPKAIKGEERVFLNPDITYFSKDQELGLEGCLSVPGVSGQILRSKTIKFVATDLHGKPVEEEWTGFAARVIQHEVDHLNGVLFIDRLNLSEKEKVLGQYQRL